jgi:SprT protein
MNFQLQQEIKCLSFEKYEWGLKHFGLSKFILHNVLFNLRGNSAGQMQGRNGLAVLRYNMPLAENNRERFLAQTVPHEVAHIINWQLGGHNHDKQWKWIMIEYGVEPERCHSYEMPVGKLLSTYSYKCNCRTYELSKTRHNRILNGTTYSCNLCKGKLVKVF